MQQYEQFREHGWKSYDDCAKVFSFFRKTKPNEPLVDLSLKTLPSKWEQPTIKCSLELVIHLMRETMFTKRVSTVNGRKIRKTYRKKFLDMKEYDIYTWVSLIEDVRFASRNNENFIYLSPKEKKLIEG